MELGKEVARVLALCSGSSRPLSAPPEDDRSGTLLSNAESADLLTYTTGNGHVSPGRLAEVTSIPISENLDANSNTLDSGRGEISSPVDDSDSPPIDAQVSGEQLGILAAGALLVITRQAKEVDVLSDETLESMDVEMLKDVYAGLICLFVEAAKVDLSPQALGRHLLATFRFTEERADVLSKTYGEHQSNLTNVLCSSANHSHLAQLADVTLHLDYSFSSRIDRPLKVPLYHLKLHSKKDNVFSGGQDLEMTCNIEELQDLVMAMKDACRSVETSVSGKERLCL